MKCELCNENGYIWIPSLTNKSREILVGQKCYSKIQQQSVIRTMQLKGKINQPCQQRVRVSMEQDKIWIRSWD